MLRGAVEGRHPKMLLPKNALRGGFSVVPSMSFSGCLRGIHTFRMYVHVCTHRDIYKPTCIDRGRGSCG